MQDPANDRRRTSYAGLLDSAIRSITKLAASSDPVTRTFANQALSDLVKLRRQMPSRRQFDTTNKDTKK
jgi:hypothetical protein